MGRKKKDRKASSSEEDSSSSKEEEHTSSENETKEEEAARSPKPRKKHGTEKTRESHQDRNVERSRWESPDSRKRRHNSPGGENQRRRSHRDQRGQEGSTKWEKNPKDTRESDRDFDQKRKKDDNNRMKNERRDPPDRDPSRDNNRNSERPAQRNENRENRPNDRFEGRGKSPRRNNDERNRRFEERDKPTRNYNENRGRRGGGRGNRFGNNDGPRSRFDGSRVKSEPSPDWGKATVKDENEGKPVEKEKPNFEPSGKLTEDANTVNGVVIKYTEPLEARKPKRRWRLYPFKGEKALPTLYVHRQSAFLMGRDRKVADIPLDHPSCSKQHAALQFRLVSFARDDGGEGKRVRPYLIDLESANGTFVNDVKLEAKRYHELLERDVLKFGFSSREYVLLHEQSRDDALDDDVPSPAPNAQVKN